MDVLIHQFTSRTCCCLSGPHSALRRWSGPVFVAMLAASSCLVSFIGVSSAKPIDPKQHLERTSFQTGSPWDGGVQIGSDVVMCYGIGPDIGARLAEWRAQGYITEVMTGVAWGNYQDYLYGRFDGINHVDEAQMDKNGHAITHDPRGGDVYYMSPGINYGKYLCVGVKAALDGGASAINLEEPEFWVRAGWSDGFKREWKAYYGTDWVAPDSSPDAQYKASYLKYYLYRRALKQVFDFVKEYNKQHGTNVKCYVDTHSLVNYASWGIVSPESSLLKVGADGFIAQVWTGTARTPNTYEGRTAERTFDTAFLEYGAMTNVVHAGGGKMWFLNDPVEDNPDHSWNDYRTNWESTLTASLLWPEVWRYEVMPWPNRIFHGTYPTEDAAQRTPNTPVTKEPIPADYATELEAVVTTLNNMHQSDVSWDSGTRGIGLLISDSMMFQRGEPNPSDLGFFFGLALPLLTHGMPVEPVQLENATLPHALAPYKVLLMTYEGMKPMTEADSNAVAKWVKSAGTLVFVDNGQDPYNSVQSWWNKAPNQFKTPSAALYAELGLPANITSGTYKAGKGTLIFDASSPSALSHVEGGGAHILDLVKKACVSVNLPYSETNYVALRRGPYVIAAGLDESLPGPSKKIEGHFVNLFDANLPITTSVTLNPGSRYLLLDIDKWPAHGPSILASACKTLGAKQTSHGGFDFFAEGPDNVMASVRLRLNAPPKSVSVDGNLLPIDSQIWDAVTSTLLIRFPNSAQGYWVSIR